MPVPDRETVLLLVVEALFSKVTTPEMLMIRNADSLNPKARNDWQ